MDRPISERRRLLTLLAFATLAVPAVALAGCASGGGTRPPNFRTGGGNRGGEKGGGSGGGPGGTGSR
jgi:hypothetical protein